MTGRTRRQADSAPRASRDGRFTVLPALLSAFLVLAAASPGCAGAPSGSGGGTRRGGASLGLADALTAALDRHRGALPYSVSRVTYAGRAAVGVGLLTDGDPLGVFYWAEGGAFADERREPAMDEEEAEALAALRERLASGGTTLRTSLRTVESRYVMADVRGVSLLVRGGRLFLRVATGSESAEVEHFHDATSGEVASLPDAGVDAGPVDAGPPDGGRLDAGPDAGPRDAGRRR